MATHQRSADTDADAAPLLSVENLSIEFPTGDGGVVNAVRDVSFAVDAGETVGLVGESGAGKSVTAQSILGLVDEPGRVSADAIRFHGEDIHAYTDADLNALRGSSISMIFQDPQTHLNPVYPVGEQIAEAIRIHQETGRRAARERAVAMLDRVGIADPEQRYDDYPHQFSGGQKQRALIAIALACDPELLIADEPTTALDVTTEARIIRLIEELSAELDTAVLFITHDLSVVAEFCDRVAVMYAGEVVEESGVRDLFAEPLHPYTEGLLDSIPARTALGERIEPIPGSVPDPRDLPAGCAFHPRCPYAVAECEEAPPPLRSVEDRRAACYKYVEGSELS